MGKPTGAAAATAKVGVKCGARRRTGGTCTLAAGWGTNHYGIGCCKLHGGSTPNQVKAAASQEYRTLLGNPIEINPLDALLACIRIRYGEVVWLTNKIAELDESEWLHDTIVGKQMHIWVKERHGAMQDLARYSSQAISLGISERAVRMAETYGERLAQLISGILSDLELTTEQRAQAPTIVRRHLVALDGGLETTPKELAA